jgi:F-type H+-transporting ATPase subunit b
VNSPRGVFGRSGKTIIEVIRMFRRILLAIVVAVGLAAMLSRNAVAQEHADNAMTGAAHAEGNAEHAKPGLLPPLFPKNEAEKEELHENFMHAIWVLIIFVVLLAILYPTAWKNVLAGLKAREKRIRDDIAAAEQQRLKAEATLKEYNFRLTQAENQVRQMINDAVAQGEKAATEVRMRATKEAEESRERAMREIEGARKEALAQIYASAAELSTSIAEKIIRRNLNAQDQRDLVQRSLEELQTVSR